MHQMVAHKPQAQPFARPKLLRDASWQAVYEAMASDPAVHVFGEGAAVKAHYDAPKIERDFAARVHTMPICEDGSVNFAVGASLLGVKPIVDCVSADFLYRAMDSIVNTAAKLRDPQPIVIRAEFLLGGPTTGQRPEAMFAHVPGLRVVIPSTPRDAHGLMRTALETPGVTLYFEDRMIEDAGPWEDSDLDGARGNHHVAFGSASWRQRGMAGVCSVFAYGVMRQRVERILKAHPRVAGPYDEPNMRVDFYDLRSLYPLDLETILRATKRAPYLLVIEPDVQFGGMGAEIAAFVAEQVPNIRVRRLGARRQTAPAAASLHHHFLPSDEEIIHAITSW